MFVKYNSSSSTYLSNNPQFGTRHPQRTLAIEPRLNSIPENGGAIKQFTDEYARKPPEKRDEQHSTITLSTYKDDVQPTPRERSKRSSGNLTKPPTNLPKLRED
jgi:hypothetical protein